VNRPDCLSFCEYNSHIPKSYQHLLYEEVTGVGLAFAFVASGARTEI